MAKKSTPQKKIIMICAVTKDAGSITTRWIGSWMGAVTHVLGWVQEKPEQLDESSPVFFREVSDPAHTLEQHSIAQLRRDLLSGVISSSEEV